jgi:adenylate cyclase class 2
MTVQREIEVKFSLSGPEAMREALLGMGAAFKGRHHEVNLRFDDARCALSAQKIVLRLRQTEGARGVQYILTLKTPLPDADPAFKILRECETEVSDGEAMRRVLEGLGYEVYWRYEKYREVYRWRLIEAALDETPIGWFIELEGPAAAIREMVDALGLSMGNALTAGYAELFRRVCAAQRLTARDMTFENFAEITIRPEDFLGLHEKVWDQR